MSVGPVGSGRGRPARDPVDIPTSRSGPRPGVRRRQQAEEPVRAGLWAGARGAVVGGLLGALVALPIAFFIFEDVSVWVRLAVLGFTGFLAGATIGFSLAGGWSDDDADNGLGIEDQRREEAAGYDGNPRSGGESGAGGSSPRSSGTR